MRELISSLVFLAEYYSVAILWGEWYFRYGWDFVFCFAMLLVFALHRKIPTSKFKFIIPSLAVNCLLYFYGLYIPAFILTVALYLYLFFCFSSRVKRFAAIPLVALHFMFLIFFISSIVAAVFGERFYTYSPASRSLFVGYQSAKVIGFPGARGAEDWYFYEIGIRGVRKVMTCSAHYSKHQFRAYVELFKKQGANMHCPDPPGG